jgi:hypothetical protein
MDFHASINFTAVCKNLLTSPFPCLAVAVCKSPDVKTPVDDISLELAF